MSRHDQRDVRANVRLEPRAERGDPTGRARRLQAVVSLRWRFETSCFVPFQVTRSINRLEGSLAGSTTLRDASSPVLQRLNQLLCEQGFDDSPKPSPPPFMHQ
jgi:hypothetical protein